MQVTFTGRRQLSADVWEYTFTPEAPVEYVAGQYARFTFPYVIADPRGKQHRTFSLVSHPSENTIRFITRLAAPLSVFKQPLSELTPGKTMFIDEPHGDAILPRAASTPVVFVARGIAVASYISMLRDMQQHSLAHHATLIWARRAEDTALSSLIPQIATLKQIDIIYPERLTTDLVATAVTPDSLVYLSGSQTFVETFGEALEASGIGRERIIYDYYSGYAEL